MHVTSPAVKWMVFKHSNTGITRQDQNQPPLLLSIRPPTSDVLACRPAPSSPITHQAYTEDLQLKSAVWTHSSAATRSSSPSATNGKPGGLQEAEQTADRDDNTAALPWDHLPQPLQVHVTTRPLMKPTFLFFLQIYAYTISQVVFLLCFCPNRPTQTLTPGYNFTSHSRVGCWLPTTGESQWYSLGVCYPPLSPSFLFLEKSRVLPVTHFKWLQYTKFQGMARSELLHVMFSLPTHPRANSRKRAARVAGSASTSATPSEPPVSQNLVYYVTVVT